MSETKYFLAVDIGASSGRHILAHIEGDRTIRLEEIYRFYNGMDEVDGHRVWDTERLFHEIVAGMKQCGELGKKPVSMG
ncbi:MAG: rhamnulokinase, partial [Butyrivibrio sp.]|nr:rhamnulokinase [Butyrivibrio sp.]